MNLTGEVRQSNLLLNKKILDGKAKKSQQQKKIHLSLIEMKHHLLKVKQMKIGVLTIQHQQKALNPNLVLILIIISRVNIKILKIYLMKLKRIKNLKMKMKLKIKFLQHMKTFMKM